MATMTGLRCQHFQAIEGRRVGKRPGGGIDVDVPGGIDAAGGIDAVSLAGIKVVCAVRGRGVHRAGAGVGGDVGGQTPRIDALEERMLECDAVERGALEAGEFFVAPSLQPLRPLRASSAATM